MPHPQVQQRFRNCVADALNKFHETSGLQHAGVKGGFREIFTGDILKLVLGGDFITGAGLVVDHTGGTSPQTDVVIFDKFHVPAILYNLDSGLFPIEGVYYYGEVKSRLTRQEAADAVKKFRSFLSLNPLPNNQGAREWPPRFLFGWSSDLKGGIESELERYMETDDAALTNPAATILCVVGKGYCYAAQNPDGTSTWYKIGTSDGVQEVVNFIGGIANSLIASRLKKFGVRFGNYVIPDSGISPVKLA